MFFPKKNQFRLFVGSTPKLSHCAGLTSRNMPVEKIQERMSWKKEAKQRSKAEKQTLLKAFPDNVEDKIKADKKRTEKDISDDLAFFADHKLDWPIRKMAFDSVMLRL